MYKISRRLTLFALITYPIDIIRIYSESISLYRIFLILALATSVLTLFKQGAKIQKGKSFNYILLGLITSVMAFTLSKDPSYAKSVLLNDLSGIGLIIVISINYTLEDIDYLMKYFVLAQIPAIPFGIYSYKFFTNAFISVEKLTFAKIFIIKIDKMQFIETTQNLRLFLPYPNATVLSVTMAVMIAILIYKGKDLFPNKVLRIGMLISYTILLIFSQSRTGILALGIVTIIYSFLKSIKTGNLKHFLKMCFSLITVFIIAVIIIKFSSSVVIAKFIKRVNVELSQSATENRHLLVPLEGIFIWLSSFSNIILGAGYGGNERYITRWTYLPNNSFLNSYVTILVQKGILGLMMIKIWFTSIKHLKIYGNNRKNDYILISWLILLVSCIFYEIYQSSTFWIMLSIVLLISKKVKKGEILK